MRTTKPISTISYNTESFLLSTLKRLKQNGIIEFWVFIKHIGEPPEFGDNVREKDHVHLHLIPSKLIQTTDLDEYFIELVPGEKLPRKTHLWVSSKWGDWYLYSLHDPAYLASKGEKRKYHYKYSDMVSSDDDTLYEKSKSIDMMKFTPYARMINAHSEGLTFGEFFKRGGVPIQQVAAFQHAWKVCFDDSDVVRRSPTHSPSDEELSENSDSDNTTLVWCDVCGQLKPDTDFTIFKNGVERRHGICRSCKKNYSSF